MQDLIFIGILLLGAFFGYRKGILRTVLNLVSGIIGIIIARLISPYITDFLLTTPLNAFINDTVYEKLRLSEMPSGMDMSVQNEYIASLPITDNMRQMLIDNNTNAFYNEYNINDFSAYVTEGITMLVIKTIAIILAFVLAFTIIRVFLSVTDLLTKIPIIKGVNKLLGAILGAINMYIVMWLFVLIISVTMPETYLNLRTTLDTGYITPYVFNAFW